MLLLNSIMFISIISFLSLVVLWRTGYCIIIAILYTTELSLYIAAIETL